MLMNFSLKSCVFEKNFVRQKDEMCEQGQTSYPFVTSVFCDHLDLTLRRNHGFLVLPCHFRYFI